MHDRDREYMKLAISQASKSPIADSRIHPKVGAIVVKDGEILARAYRGEIESGEHAEYTALEKKLSTESLAGSTVYTTLEPCTTRNHPKVPCAERLIERKVARVVIGMLDPNQRICGRGLRRLRDANIATAVFPSDLMAEVEEQNRDFIRWHQEASDLSPISGFHKNRGTEPHLIDRYLPKTKHEIAMMAVQFTSIVHQYMGALAQKAAAGCKVKILMMAPRDPQGNANPNVEAYESQRTYTRLRSRLENTTDTFKEWLSTLDAEVLGNIQIRQYLEHPTVSMFFVDKDDKEGFLRVEVLPYKADAHDFPNYQIAREDDDEFFDFHCTSFNRLWNNSAILQP